MLIDSHCHLAADEFQHDRDTVVAAARASGVQTMIVPAVDRANFAAVRRCCAHYPGCFPAYGIHPLFVADAELADLQALDDLLRDVPPVAIGEIGLDLYRHADDFARQEHFFVEQLKIARKFDLPVLLHSRRAVDPVLKQLRRHRVRGGIAHAFNGSRQQADAFLAMGLKLGFGGAATYERATRLRALAQTLPSDAVVMETDSPDIPPHWLYTTAEQRAAGQPQGRNEPAELPRIAAEVAQLRGVSVGAWAEATTANALAALPRLQRLWAAPPAA